MELQTVHIFSAQAGLRGWFTQKNAERINTEGRIPGLNCGLSTPVPVRESEENRMRLFGFLDMDPDNVALAQQVHGSRVETVTKGGLYRETDALITETPGVALAIQVADCAAVLLADPANNVIGAVHAGWRGAVEGIVPKTVDEMVRRKSGSAERFLAYISPCISLRHFEVGEEVAAFFPDRFVDRDTFEKPHVDLKGFIHHQLRSAGIPESRIEPDSGCTFADAFRYFSWRREREQAGRMLAVIQLKSPTDEI